MNAPDNDPLADRIRDIIHNVGSAVPAADSPRLPDPHATRAVSQRHWAVAAAGVLVVVGVVALATRGGSDPEPATGSDTTLAQAPTTHANSYPSTTLTPPTTYSALPTGPVQSGTIAVSFQDPPGLLQLAAIATIRLPAGSNGPGYLPPVAALGGGGVAVIDNAAKQIIVIQPSGTKRIPMSIDPGPVLVSGDHNMVYGIVQQSTPTNAAGAAVVAIPLTGSRAGTVVGSAPVSILPYTEAAATLLGHGRTGIIDRNTGEQLLRYFDTNGGPLALDADPPNYHLDSDGVVHTADGTAAWRLAIDRDPTYPGANVTDPPPAQIGGGHAIYWTSIGPAKPSTTGVAEATMPVLAMLDTNRTGTWYRIPDGWSVVASDEGGVILAKRDGDNIQLAAPSTSVEPTSNAVDTTVAVSTTDGASPTVVGVAGRGQCSESKQLPGFGTTVYANVLSCFDVNFGGQLVIDSPSLWRAGSTVDGQSELFHSDASLKPLGGIPVPATVLAMAPDRGSMWAITTKSAGASAHVVKVDIATRRIVLDHALPGTSIPDGPTPAAAVVIDGNDVWLTIANGPATIIHYQTDGTYIGKINIAASANRMVALTGHLYALTNTGDVLAIDTTTKAVTSLAKLPAPTTFAGAIAAAGDDLWADTTELIHIDLPTGKITDRTPALISDLAADPRQPGRAWAAPFEPDPNSVPGTGAGSVVRLSLHGVHPDGSLHFETLMTNGIDELAFANDGTLYGSNGYSAQLVRIMLGPP